MIKKLFFWLLAILLLVIVAKKAFAGYEIRDSFGTTIITETQTGNQMMCRDSFGTIICQ